MAALLPTFTLHVPTPLGEMRLTASQDFLFSACFSENTPKTESDVPPAVLRLAASQLEEYFAGTRTTFELPLQPQGTTFQQQVWHALQQVPAGQTEHYLVLAKRLGKPGAVRAVGAANGANPWLVLVPCHRIIGAQGQLVGYAGGLWRKKWLLAHEAKQTGNYQGELF